MAIGATILAHVIMLLPNPSSLLMRINSTFNFTVGVDLFFVVSGFVITRSLLTRVYARGNRSSKKVLADFWLKRAYRLLPAAWFWLVLISIYVYFMGYPFGPERNFVNTLQPIVASMMNVMNLYSSYCIEDTSSSGCFSFFYLNSHYWSLSLEEQFYFIYPLLFLFLPRRVLLASAIIIIIGLFFVKRPFLSYGWHFRVDGLCWGVLIGLFSISKKYSTLSIFIHNNKFLIRLLSYGLLLSLFWWTSVILSPAATAEIYGLSMVAAISALIVFLATFDIGMFGRWAKNSRILSYFGSRSYSIYLSHMIVFILFKATWGVGFPHLDGRMENLVVLVLGLIGVLICSEFTFQHVEKRFRR
ncbi:hypothetical protein SIN8267_02392 [Sinobacterium norvegicum]|uniref:Acyltransferase 3 domain-containing protein n=1 Tax=Sinobacterium norvegicum TaxID=1641715 RepID=A0ABM9AH14_9GAMM|nr:hypothetical protein SIN8267_02392 [Sinobacterium norvegicum]